MATRVVASIILPYQDSEMTVERCIKSIIEQEFKEWELIAIDDHSKDSTRAKLEEYSKLDNRIRSVRNQGKGIVDALNYGISIAKSEIIVRMDSDDEMLPARLGCQLQFLEKNRNVGLVGCAVRYCVENKSDFFGRGYSCYVDWSNQIFNYRQIQIHQFEESPFAHPSVAFRKTLTLEHGGYKNGSFPEDYELWLRWISKGVKMEKLKACLLNWYDAEDRLSRVGERYSQEAFQKIKAKYLNLWLEERMLKSRNICAWGAGKVASKQSKFLIKEGVLIERYYDINPRKIGKTLKGRKIFPINEISRSRNEFIIVLTGTRDAKPEIIEYLCKKQLKIGLDFIFLA